MNTNKSRIEKRLQKISARVTRWEKQKMKKEVDAIDGCSIYENSVINKECFHKWFKNYVCSGSFRSVFEEKSSVDEESLWLKYKKTVLDNSWIKLKPLITKDFRSPQLEFLLCQKREVLYGGAGGGGKTVALLSGALQHVDCPGYAALLLRRRITDLKLPDSMLDLAHRWLDGTNVRFDSENNVFVFPSGAKLVFGYCNNLGDEERYRSSQFQYIGVDELTEGNESQYLFLFSRLRRSKRLQIPLRMRTASNPGGVGHLWVKQRFIVEAKNVEDRGFIPAKLVDNPEIDQEGYIESLMHLDHVRRKQIQDGDWSINPEGRKFYRSWFKIVKDYPRGEKVVRYWDKAATEPKRGKDPDYTVGVKATSVEGVVYVLDVVRFRGKPKDNETRIRQTAVNDGKDVEIFMEQEPGSAGVNDIDNYARRVLQGFCFRGEKTTGSKEIRANPLSSLAEQGHVCLIQAPWNTEFLDEFEMFPDGAHDDIVDATSGAYNKLTTDPPLGGAMAPKAIGGYEN